MELKRQEQRVRQLQRQFQQTESEKKLLSENVHDAETALRTAARDRETLAEYAANVLFALEQVSNESECNG